MFVRQEEEEVMQEEYLKFFLKEGKDGNLSGLHAEAYRKYEEVQESQGRTRENIAALSQQIRQAQERIQQLNSDLQITIGRASGILETVLLLDRIDEDQEKAA